jgi:hypothetical protein
MEHFIPARVHVREQPAERQRLGERYGVQWTPTILELDADGAERIGSKGSSALTTFSPSWS